MNRFLCIAALLCATQSSWSVPIDLEAEVSGGNQSFGSNRASTSTALTTGSYGFGGSAALGVGISDNLTFVTQYERSAVFGNLTRFTFRHRDQFVSVGAGASFGVANSAAVLLKPAVYTSIRFDLPGLLYARFTTERTLRTDPKKAGDYVMDSLGLATGFYLPNAIFTLRYHSDSREKREASGSVLDIETDYFADIDVFAKNVPYRVLLSFGYRDVTRSYVTTSVSRHTTGFLILGTHLFFDLSDNLAYRVGVDSSVYTFGRNALIGEFANDTYVFRASTGVSYSFGSF
jgi:hypothetical protein